MRFVYAGFRKSVYVCYLQSRSEGPCLCPGVISSQYFITAERRMLGYLVEVLLKWINKQWNWKKSGINMFFMWRCINMSNHQTFDELISLGEPILQFSDGVEVFCSPFPPFFPFSQPTHTQNRHTSSNYISFIAMRSLFFYSFQYLYKFTDFDVPV